MINGQTDINKLLKEIPECAEFLYPFLGKAVENPTLAQLSIKTRTSLSALITGLERYVKRAEQYLCNYTEMRNRLIKPGTLNVAGFTNFLLQETLIDELNSFAQANKIPLNLNIFPKHEKKKFQNYLAVCNSPDDLPEVLIGKGFSSLTTSRFVDKFVSTGSFVHPVKGYWMDDVFANAGIADNQDAYHPFAVEEVVMVYDKSVDLSVQVPASWDDILTDTYKGAITQMGKPQRDYFGFIMMLYLFAGHGEEGIKRFAGNVQSKQHFTQIIKNIGKHSEHVASVNVMHRFASKFIRSNALDNVQTIEPPEGNPTVCHFFLLKNSAPEQALKFARHLYSPAVKKIIEKCGISHITSDTTVSGHNTVRWIGWDTLRELQLPWLKEYLGEIAFNNYKNIQS